MRTRHDKRFRILVPCVAVLLVYLLLEGACAGGLVLFRRFLGTRYDPNISALSERQKIALQNFLASGGRGQYARQHPVLGWVSVTEANSAGMRDNQEYPTVPDPGVVRIAAFGDSFTYGSDVALGETWAKQLRQLNPSLEVLNYGVGAYGLDQAYLRYRLVGSAYHPHIVFIGYMTENISRNVNVFRPFYTSAYRDVIFTKPRFIVKGGELVLLANPVATLADHARLLKQDREVLRELGQNDYHYQTKYDASALDILPTVRLTKMLWAAVHQRLVTPIFNSHGTYQPGSEAYDVTVKIIEAFHRDVLANGALPLIVIFPDLTDQWRSRAKKPRRYSPLLDELRRRGYRHIDVLQAFEPYESQLTVPDLTRQWGHYSPLGQNIVAQFIEKQLRHFDLTEPARIDAAVQAEQTARKRP